MRSGEHLAVATTTTVAEVELIRTRMRVTVAMLDRAIAARRRSHLTVIDGDLFDGQRVGDDG